MKRSCHISILGSAIFLAACGGGGGDGGGSVDLQLAPDLSANSKISHGREARALEAGISVNIWGLPDVQSFFSWYYLDLDGDGDLDLFVAQGVGPNEPGNSASNPRTLPMQAYRNDDGEFVRDDSLLGTDIPDGEHPRKTLAMDFNGNGQEDIIVLDHGYDAHPFPGSSTRYLRSVVRNNGSITYKRDDSLSRVGFHHCGAAGDIDHDGDIDVLVGGANPFFYVNDGSGNFSEVTNRLTKFPGSVYTCELIDLDGDGYLDILAGGHEWNESTGQLTGGTPTQILWGNSTGTWSSDRRTILPPVANYGVVLDFTTADINGNGRLDLIITRASGPEDFYDFNYMQVVTQGTNRRFADATKARLDKYAGAMPCGATVALPRDGGGFDIRVPSPYGEGFANCDIGWDHIGNGYYQAVGIAAELNWGTLP